MNKMNDISKGKLVSYICILAIICICGFLIAKYIVRNDINGEEIPIDTSTRI